MISYANCLIFSEDLRRILLVRKTKTIFKGMLNAVGGKQEPGETRLDCAIREVREETGLDVSNSIFHVGSVNLHVNCNPNADNEVQLDYWFATACIEDAPARNDSGEPLEIVPVHDLLEAPATSTEFAGEGDLQWMVNLALRMHAQR